jgi:hypothetical protein
MLVEDVRLLVQQCGSSIEIIVDNARSHSDSMTQSVEQLPPLRPYSKSVGIAKRKRNQQRSITMDRWTAERRAPSPSFASPVTISSPKLTKTTSPSMGSVDSSNSSPADSHDLSPRLVRRLPSNDGMTNDSYCNKDIWKGSPRRPTRKESIFNVCAVAALSNRHHHCDDKDSHLLYDSSPRKPARRHLSFLPEEKGKLNESSTTVQFIIEALAIANLYGDEIEEETTNNSSDESTVSSFASTSSSSEKTNSLRSPHPA